MENTGNFYWWFEQRLAYSKVKHSFYTWKNLNAAYRKAKTFRPDLAVHEVNYKFLKDFEAHLLSTGLSTNTVACHLVRIRVMITELINNEIIIRNPFARFTIDTTRTHKARITIEEIIRLHETDLSQDPNAAEARDMYILSFYCAGIRFGDLCRLRKVMIRDGCLCYTMHKSLRSRNPKRRRIKLGPAALRIAFAREGEFIFNTGVDWSNEDRSISSRNVLYNRWLKRACRAAGIPPLSFHTSRNSFADHAKRKHLDVHTLKDMFGHSKVTTTEIYMQNFYEEETDQAFMQLFG